MKSWSDMRVKSGKIVKICMPKHYTQGIFGATMRIVIEKPDGKTYEYCMAMAGIRNLANQILGRHSSSYTELRNAFMNYALYSTFINYVEYGTKEKRNTVINHGWTIL